MDGQNYVVFHNDSDDSYMNSSANFRGAEIAATALYMYFESPISATTETGGAYDKITLTITAGSEEVALETIAAALAGAKNPVTVIADDPDALMIVLGQKVAFGAGKYRSGPKFELIFYGAV